MIEIQQIKALPTLMMWWQEVLRQVFGEKSRECWKIYLETTEDGRPVYESIGFRDLPDILKYYD